MKQTRVPAQITTVEDKIAGNLSFTQILLLIAALFCAMLVYILFPVPLKITYYKIPLILLLSGICLFLAIRIRGKVIIQWIGIIAAYVFRPQYYVFNKNDMTNREMIVDEVIKPAKTYAEQKIKVKEKQQIESISDVMAVERVLLNPNQHVRFAFRKGDINVSVSESK